MTKLHDLAYKLDAALWVKDVLGIDPAPWQRQFLSAPRGASILALTAAYSSATARPLQTKAVAHKPAIKTFFGTINGLPKSCKIQFCNI